MTVNLEFNNKQKCPSVMTKNKGIFKQAKIESLTADLQERKF